MAAGDLALPVGHVPAIPAPAGPAALQFCAGRRFRQPIDMVAPEHFSAGLELWLNAASPDSNLYAMFDGALTFRPAPAAGGAALVVAVSSPSQDRFKDIRGVLEPPPFQVTYDNVDQPGVRNALIDLILNAHAASAGLAAAQWHPCLRQQWNGALLQGQVTGVVAADVADAVVAPVAGAAAFALDVASGDPIGLAADPQAADPRPDPAACAFAATAKRVTVRIEEYAGNLLNPVYYLWRLMKDAVQAPVAQRRVRIVSHVSLRADNLTFDHPLLDRLGINLDTEVRPRLADTYLLPGAPAPDDVLLFPTGRLSDWGGVEFGANQSQIEWRITDDEFLRFETRPRPGVVPAALGPVSVDPYPAGAAMDPYRDMVQDVWNDWAADINDICMDVQFPAELIVVTVAHETQNHPRLMALERLKIPLLGNPAHGNPAKNHELRLQNAGIPQAVINQYKALTPRYGLHVPGNVPGAGDGNAVDAARSPLTWAQLYQIMDVVPECMSPGLSQTLISSARSNLTWLARGHPDVYANLGIPPPPAIPHLLFNWLLNGRNAILAAAAYHKNKYVNAESAMNPPLMAAMFNAGSLRYSLQRPDRDLGPGNHNNPWRLLFNDLQYPRNAARYYNAIQDLFRGGANGAVRFWRNLP